MEDDKQIVNIVNVNTDNNIFIEKESVFIISQGEQGPAGPMGPSGGSTALTYVPVIPISGHKIVCIDLTGNLNYASSDNLNYVGRVLGLTMNAAVAGDPVQVLTVGEIQEPSWNFTVGLPVFLGLNGNITQTYPTSGFSQIIGFALTSNKLYVKLQEPMILN